MRAALTRHREALALGLIVATTAVVATMVRRDGHWWGDDWALYVRQADSLLGGWVGQVVADNRFTVEVSGLPEFSPPMYPWGYAILLAPFVALLGTDLDRLVISQVVFLGWFVVMWYRLARPRVGAPLALTGAVIVGLSPQYLRWSEFIQSELAFIAVAATGLVLLDRARNHDTLISPGTSLWPLAAVGVAAALAFSIRREGLALVAAIGVAQLAALAPVALGAWRGGTRWPRREVVGRLSVPYLSALAVVGALQLLLPSTLVPRYEGNGLHNVWGFASSHLGNVMETLGLRTVGVDTPTVLGHTGLGTAAVVMFVLIAVAGIVVSVLRRPTADLPILAFTVVALLIGGSFRFAGTRYVAVIGPMVLIFALAGLRLVAGTLLNERRRISPVACVALGIVVLLAVGNVGRAIDQIGNTREFGRTIGVQWGPDHPDSLAMYAAVRDETEAGDVIGFFKARSITQRTDRRAVQVDRWHPLARTIGEVTHVVLQRADPDRDRVVADVDIDRLDPVWSNGRFVMYQIRN